jgi:hypothetical protein
MSGSLKLVKAFASHIGMVFVLNPISFTNTRKEYFTSANTKLPKALLKNA